MTTTTPPTIEADEPFLNAIVAAPGDDALASLSTAIKAHSRRGGGV